MPLLRSFRWKAQSDFSSARIDVPDLDQATMSLSNRPNDRQPQPRTGVGATRLGLTESFEGLIAEIWVEATSFVFYVEGESVGVPDSAQSYLTVPMLEGVINEVAQCLLESQ